MVPFLWAIGKIKKSYFQRVISKLVAARRPGIAEMSCDCKGPEEKWGMAGREFMERGYSPPLLGYHAPAALCGWPAVSLGRGDMPPMLAAQSAFPSWPQASFRQEFKQLIWR